MVLLVFKITTFNVLGVLSSTQCITCSGIIPSDSWNVLNQGNKHC